MLQWMANRNAQSPAAPELCPTPVLTAPSCVLSRPPLSSQPLAPLPPSTSAAPSSASLPPSLRSPCSKRNDQWSITTITNPHPHSLRRSLNERLATILLPALLVQCAGDAFARFDVYMKTFSHEGNRHGLTEHASWIMDQTLRW